MGAIKPGFRDPLQHLRDGIAGSGARFALIGRGKMTDIILRMITGDVLQRVRDGVGYIAAANHDRIVACHRVSKIHWPRVRPSQP
jgi:hypothetical protein